MSYEIRIENIPEPRPLAVVRRKARSAELSKIIPACCGIVWGVVKSAPIAGAGRLVAVYWDGEINLEIGVEVERPITELDGTIGLGEVVPSAIPAGAAATTVHFGPYDRLAAAHQAVRDWAAANGHALAGPSWEIYGHWLPTWNSDPSLIRTDVYWLLKAGGDSCDASVKGSK